MAGNHWSDVLSPLKRVAFDTNSLIYFIERQPPYGPMVREALWKIHRGSAVAVISTVVELELLVKPLREKDSRLIDSVDMFLRNQRNLIIRSVDREVAQAAAEIRAATRMQTPDAIIAATAAAENCDAIIGNDRGFARRSEVPYLLLDDYAG